MCYKPGVTATTRAVLVFLAGQKRPLNAHDIAAAMRLDDGRSVSASLVSLRDYGMVARTVGARQKPYTPPEMTWQITDKGRAGAAGPPAITKERW